MRLKLRSAGHLFRGNYSKIWLTGGILFCLLLAALVQPLPAANDTFKIYLEARSGIHMDLGSGGVLR